MIDTAKLIEARILGDDGGMRTFQERLDDNGDRIRGPLERLAELVLEYNGIRVGGTPAAQKQRIQLLDTILMRAAWWLTNNPPRKSSSKHKTNPKRWAALADVAEQVRRELKKLGSRTLSGPNDFKTIDKDRRSYWLERMDPDHRPGWVLSKYYEEWLDKSHKKGDFFEWVDKRYNEKSVAYLPKAGRESYEVRLVGNLLVNTKGEPFDTRHLSTCFSDYGWAIFVCSAKDGKIYAGSHVEGEFHHSSFLKGKPVLAAGEICAEKGRIRIITAKSGHYWPSADDMQNFVKQFSGWQGAMIYPDFSSKIPRIFPVRTFIDQGLSARTIAKAAVLRQIPKWAQNEKTEKWLNAIPEFAS